MKMTVGLTQNSKLLVEDKVLSSECTSMFMYGNFLLFTAFSNGLSHILYIYNVHEQKFRQFLTAENPSNLLPNPQSKSLNVRCVERGSKLVNVSNDKVIVQMPRGNLEGFSPRLLMLHRIK
mmetsp:Transcript_16622/g.14471  ORF Transcript_16622/g.14471 Transcript_16622/m.14471 type:complete len:121 (+) Transcript_16622:642-1004(+)